MSAATVRASVENRAKPNPCVCGQEDLAVEPHQLWDSWRYTVTCPSCGRQYASNHKYPTIARSTAVSVWNKEGRS